MSLPTEQESTADKVICRLCRRQFAKYTCPTCNVPYCSLTCFRSEPHSQCSETFYKKEVETDIRSEPSKSAEERLKMLELLKNFEESQDIEDYGEEDEESDGDDMTDLAGRFEAVDLNNTSSDELWSLLTPEERKKFLKVLNDPNSELVQRLLASEELEKEIRDPWWDTPSEESENVGASHPYRSPRRYGSRPSMRRVPRALMKSTPQGPPLLYNMCAICIAYAYITRHLGFSPLSDLDVDSAENSEARKLVSRLIPFVMDRKSTTLHISLSSVVTDIWSRFELGAMSSDLFALLLRDAARLMKPVRVIPLSGSSDKKIPCDRETDMDPSYHPHYMCVLVISDLSSMLWKQKTNHATHKLIYYAGHMLSTPSVFLGAVADELQLRARQYETQRE